MIQPGAWPASAALILRGAVKPQPRQSYAELQQQMHRDLIAQNPQWVQSDGTCPRCDEYDQRFAELIAIFQAASREHDKAI